ncbi:AI-2E family transporter [Gallaecimonas pentaromativorans]|uniref:Putative PurR-regulated permease PerM n=1 Tax=Gallaecimonas pentaromativorans TaxID=584787 RepID=A0A3N1PP86_9GAMM|nr:AI-2E family transporter [Gallaecimonas pentaromativorans]ROQ29979.1 putative PurR-regulated permease PerM [Gallaecimonas pentaromativorans]
MSRTWIVGLAALVIVLAGIKLSADLLVPLLLSAFIAITCNPLVNWLERHKVPRPLAVVLIIFLIVLIGLMLTGLVGSSVNQFTANIPQYRAKLLTQFAWVTDQLARLNIHLDRKQLQTIMDPGAAMNMAANTLTSLGSLLTNFFVILLTVVFMLFEAASLSEKVHRASGGAEHVYQALHRFFTSVNHYLAIKTVVSLGTGILIWAWTWGVGVDFPLLWGVLAFLLNYIPNIGSIIAAVPAVLLALLQLGLGHAGMTALGFLLVNTLMGNAVEPRLMGRGLGISTLVVFLSLIFWGWLLGSVGMLLSVPLTMIIKIALESNPSTAHIAILLSGDLPAQEEAKDARS